MAETLTKIMTLQEYEVTQQKAYEEELALDLKVLKHILNKYNAYLTVDEGNKSKYVVTGSIVNVGRDALGNIVLGISLDTELE